MSNDISNDSDFDRLIQEAQIITVGEGMAPYGNAIIEKIVEAKIKYEYEDQLAIRPYGEGEQIKWDLAEKYGKSYKTIKRILYKF